MRTELLPVAVWMVEIPSYCRQDRKQFATMEQREFFLKSIVDPRGMKELPLRWAEVFARPAPLAVEIGFGNGEFLLNWARAQPEWNIVGIELSMQSMVRFQKRLSASALPNVRAIHEDGKFALREFFPGASVRHVLMNFPDPWPKNRHKRRRLLSGEFVNILGAVLEKHGIYELVTDQLWYAQEAQALFAASSLYESREIEINPRRPVMTRYELKWREMGRSSYRFCARKTGDAAIERIAEALEMPHVIVKTEVNSAKVMRLQGQGLVQKSTRFLIKGIMQALGEKSFLLRTIATDMDYLQNFYILVKPHGAEGWIVKLDPTVQPYRTPAVKLAVETVGYWLSCGAEDGLDTTKEIPDAR